MITQRLPPKERHIPNVPVVVLSSFSDRSVNTHKQMLFLTISPFSETTNRWHARAKRHGQEFPGRLIPLLEKNLTVEQFKVCNGLYIPTQKELNALGSSLDKPSLKFYRERIMLAFKYLDILIPHLDLGTDLLSVSSIEKCFNTLMFMNLHVDYTRPEHKIMFRISKDIFNQWAKTLTDAKEKELTDAEIFARHGEGIRQILNKIANIRDYDPEIARIEGLWDYPSDRDAFVHKYQMEYLKQINTNYNNFQSLLGENLQEMDQLAVLNSLKQYNAKKKTVTGFYVMDMPEAGESRLRAKFSVKPPFNLNNIEGSPDKLCDSLKGTVMYAGNTGGEIVFRLREIAQLTGVRPENIWYITELGPNMTRNDVRRINKSGFVPILLGNPKDSLSNEAITINRKDIPGELSDLARKNQI